jgi:hypothetical protein
MSELRDPARWLESKALPPEVRRQLLSYGNAGPSAERRARMLAQLEHELGPSGAAASSGGLLSAHVKLLFGIGALVLGSLALLAMLWPAADARELVSTAPAALLSHVRSSEQPHASTATANASSTEVAAPDIGSVATAAPGQRTAELGQAAKAPARAERMAHVKRRERAASKRLASMQKTTTSAPAAAAGTGALAELTLLARARRALLGHPKRALDLAEEHALHYPQGTFEEEREVLAIESLLKLERVDQAEQRARLFEKRFPHSTHRAHLTQLVSHE